MKCQRCGKENVDPVYPHTCTPLALKCADELERCWADPGLQLRSAAELRRLHEANDDLLGTLKHARDLVAEWGACASAYEQEKGGLALDLKQLDAVIQRRTKT